MTHSDLETPRHRLRAADRLAEWSQREPHIRLTGLPPGPRWPQLLQTFCFWTARPRFLQMMRRRYGDVFTLRDAPEGQVVVLCRPDHVREVIHGNPAVFNVGGANGVFGPIVGRNSIITLADPEHRVARRRMAPPFHGDRIAGMVAAMTELTEREVSRWPVGETFPLLEHTEQLSLDILVRTVLGVDDTGRNEETGQRLRRAVPVNVVDSSLLLWPSLGRVWPWRRVLAEMDRADDLIYHEIDSCRADPDRESRSDVLSMLVDDDVDAQVVRDELVSLLVGGHQTTSAALAWMFERLLRSPDALKRVREGLDDPHDDYRSAVVKETLRVRPVVYNFVRRIDESVDLAGYKLPSGTIVMPSIAALNFDREVWGSDAQLFRPERWLEPNPPRHSWIPFGTGSKRCPGALLAQTIMETVLRTVLHHVDLVPDRIAGEKERMHHVTIVPSRGARVQVIGRH